MIYKGNVELFMLILNASLTLQAKCYKGKCLFVEKP